MFEAEINPDRIQKADLVVAIPSYNEADSIGFPTRQASQGLVSFFPDKRSVIINCDNNSLDNTREAFLSTPTRVPKIYLSTPPGVKGRGNNFKNLFRKAVDLGATAVLSVDADLKSITPEWIRRLGEPVFKGFSFVAPLYAKQKYEGLVTNGIVYPLSRALYGRRIRLPVGGECAFSGDMGKAFLGSGIWDHAIGGSGIDIWMTTLALNQGAQVCQSFMGMPRVDRAKDPCTSLNVFFREVVGTVFSLMQPFEASWMKTRYSRPTAMFSSGQGEIEPPPKDDVNGLDLMEGFQEGFQEFTGVWERSLSRDVFNKLIEMKGMKRSHFAFPTDLWARILYDLAVAHRDAVCDKGLLLDSLIPLNSGRAFSFMRRTRRFSVRQAEEAVEEDSLIFETTKPYLVKRWRETRRP